MLHTQDGGLLCGGDDTFNSHDQKTNCLMWWPVSGTWNQSHTLSEERWSHVSWTPDPRMGTYLMGGFGNVASTRSTELVKPDGDVEQGFNLKYDTT